MSNVSIIRPGQNEPANVVVGSPSGFICARGEVAQDAKERFETITIFAKIYQGVTAGDTSPPPGTQSTTTTTTNWYFPQVFGATCSVGSGFPQQTLKVWAFAGTGFLGTATQNFTGVCAAQVDCGLGSGGPPGSGSLSATRGFGAGMASRVSSIVSAAPRRWSVGPLDADDPDSPFTGRWLLRHRPTLDGHCIWDNGGDGTSIPHIELRCEGPLLSTWQLCLRLGERVVRYLKCAEVWNALAANVFTPDDLVGTASPGLPSLLLEPC
jgi:hypothetical protein